MKFIISESKLKQFIKTKMGIDLTDKIDMVQSWDELPSEFKEIFTPTAINRHLNNDGPMYVFHIGDKMYLYQNKHKVNDLIVYYNLRDENEYKPSTEFKLMDDLGLAYIGISPNELIDMYL